MWANFPIFGTGNFTFMELGSFPPKKERWSMDFFYPNFNNDMWRIIGLIFFGDKSHFEMSARTAAKRFDREKIAGFCAEKGIALYDTAEQVRRLKDNASDKFLEIVTPTDLSALLEKIPECTAIVATGEKAAEAAAAFFGCKAPATGKCIEIITRHLMFWRMPSSSRAYPLSLEKKAEAYRNMFISAGLLQS